MRILAIDDEELALELLTEAIAAARPDAELFASRRPGELLSFARENPCDVAFLDIKMRGMTGLELAQQLKQLQPRLEVIFVTGYSEYALEAFGIHARGYLMKPVDVGSVQEELDGLYQPLPYPASRLRAQTFGSFELFVEDQPLRFRRGRSKEILAYLIDRRGAAQTVAEVAAVLFEDKPYDRSLQKQMQVYLSDLRQTLREQNAEHILLHTRNSVAVDTQAFSCDYYDFIKMEPYAVRAYQGEYMNNYPWAELTLGWLEQRKE